MGARFLDDEARAAFQRAIEAIESASSVEVVVAVRRRSASYLHASLIAGIAVAFAALATMLYSSQAFSLIAILFDPFLLGLAAGGVVQLLPQVERLLTPPRTRRRLVAHAATATFVERGVHNTTARSGLLVYISWVEQIVALVADSGLRRVVADAELRTLELALTDHMRQGGAAVANLLARHAERFATVMPRNANDVNELPDAIDSDLPRPRSKP
ncbi:MAG: hypothetical protein AB7O24_13450 [Kofleriaceae bacterium]